MLKKNRITDLILMLLPVSSACMLILFSDKISLAVASSVNSCLTVIIPSLFGFMVFSSFVIKSDAYKLIGRPFSLISRYIFRMPEELFPVFLLSLIGGYPIGAKLLCDMYNEGKISKAEAENMLCFCYTGGASFILGIFPSDDIGRKNAVAICISVVISNIILAWISGLFRPVPPKAIREERKKFSPEIIVNSVESGATSLFKICIMIVFFSVIIASVNASGVISSFPPSLKNIIYPSLEISVISAYLNYFPVSFSAIFFSFGGLCILLQIFTITGNRLNLSKFLISRIPAAALAFLISYIICLFPTDKTYAIPTIQLGIRQISPLPSVLLIIMTILLLCKKTVAKQK